MEIFISRSPTGTITSQLEDLNELEEVLSSLNTFGPLEDKSEVKVEITGTWAEIKDLLSNPCFGDTWFDPKRLEFRKDG